MNISPKQIKDILQKNRLLLRTKYSIKNIGFFGSFARGDHNLKSDVDILVEFSKPIGFFKFIELEEILSEMISKKVDLVTKKGLKPIISKEILQEAVYV